MIQKKTLAMSKNTHSQRFEGFRQEDSLFVGILSELRLGRCSAETEQILKSTARPLEEKDGIKPTILFTT
jgi:hypothetical protein